MHELKKLYKKLPPNLLKNFVSNLIYKKLKTIKAMQKIKKLQRQIKALYRQIELGNYKNKVPLERKIINLCNDLKMEIERYNKEIEREYWQNEATY